MSTDMRLHNKDGTEKFVFAYTQHNVSTKRQNINCDIFKNMHFEVSILILSCKQTAKMHTNILF